MKKFIYSAIAAIGLLLSPSCSDENEALSGSGNEALVSFSVNLADGIQTKADPEPVIGDGTTAEKLYVRVFDDGGTLIDGLSDRTYDFSNRSTEVTLSLVKGKTYKFLFWAQSGETNAFSFDGTTVNVSYANAKANDEKRDAFYYAYTKTVTGSFQETVTLRRPFAQLNFLTTAEDIKAAINAGQRVEKTSITVASAARTLSPSFDPANTNPSVSVEKENAYFDFADVPFTVEDNTVSSPSCLWIKDGKVEETQGEDATKYFYLATTYFLVNNTADATAQIVLADVNMKVYGAEGDGLKVQSVPVRMNYRTNIYGNLLTSTGKFNVTITPNFNIPQLPEQDQDIEIKEREVDSEAAAAAAFAAGASKVTLTEELPSTNSTGIIPKAYADQNAEVIELVLEKPITPGYVFTYKENTGSGTNTFAPATVHITIPESLGGSSAISASNIQLRYSTVYVNGVKVTTMTAETSSNTLVVGPGTVIETLYVKQGNVRIMNDGRVGTIVRTSDNVDTDKKTIVFLEDGGELTNKNVGENIELQQSISTAAGLKAFAEAVNGGNTYAGQTVVLSADIDLNGVEWTPIGGLVSYPSVTFAGTFDGNNHTISNLTTSDFTVNHATAGFFGSITGTVKNLTLTNVNITSSHYAGGIVGYSSNRGTSVIENCHVKGGTITSTPEYTGTTKGSTNGYDNGDKVGGITGYMVAGDKVENCSVSNVTIKAYRDLGGIVGYADGAVTNNAVSDVTLIQDNTNGYKADPITTCAEVIGRGDATNTNNTYSNVTMTAKTFGALDFYQAATGGNATLTEDATLSGVYTGYGLNAKTAVKQNGGTIDGLNHTLTVKDANQTWDCSIYTKGGTIKNLTIKGGFRGIFTGGLSEDLHVENVVLDYCCYTFSADGSNGKSVYFKDCTLNGWTSYTSGFASFSFTNCSFGKGSGGYSYDYLRPYSPTTLENCRFSEGYELDTTMDGEGSVEVTLKNCYVGETLITQGNLTTLLGEDAANATVENE